MNRGGARRDDRPGDGRIEHTRQREVIKTADWIIYFGLEGGDKGGEIVAEGTALLYRVLSEPIAQGSVHGNRLRVEEESARVPLHARAGVR